MKLVGHKSNRDGIGAQVEVVAGGRTAAARAVRRLGLPVAGRPAGAFRAGAATKVDRLTVTWPSGHEAGAGECGRGPDRHGRGEVKREAVSCPGIGAGAGGGCVGVAAPIRRLGALSVARRDGPLPEAAACTSCARAPTRWWCTIPASRRVAAAGVAVGRAPKGLSLARGRTQAVRGELLERHGFGDRYGVARR